MNKLLSAVIICIITITGASAAAQISNSHLKKYGPSIAANKLLSDIALLKTEIYNKAINTLNSEPPVQKLIDAALTLASTRYRRGEHWKRASRTASLLPEIRLSAGYDGNRDETLTRYQTKPDQWGAKSYRDLGLVITATWKLSRIIFNLDELAVQRVLEDISDSREAMISTITRYYYERKKLLFLKMVDPPETMSTLIEIDMRIEELTASLNALTGGLLKKAAKK